MKLNTIILTTLALCLSLTANAQLNNPNGLAFDKDGNLWVANYGANQVLELDPSNGTVLNTITDGVNGPTRLAFDSLGNLWVANTTGGTIIGYRRQDFPAILYVHATEAPSRSESPLTHMATFTSPTMRKITSSLLMWALASLKLSRQTRADSISARLGHWQSMAEISTRVLGQAQARTQ